jgi:hypothetical protein
MSTHVQETRFTDENGREAVARLELDAEDSTGFLEFYRVIPATATEGESVPHIPYKKVELTVAQINALTALARVFPERYGLEAGLY